jgi:hypothetical protein
MTPTIVCYTGLDIDPGPLLRERCIRGIIPPDWQRCHFALAAQITYPIGKMNRWLQDNIEGSWAIYTAFARKDRRITIAFEHEFDAVTFMMADGKTQAFKEDD